MSWIVLFSLVIITLLGASTWMTVHARTETLYRALSVVLFLGSFPALLAAFAFVIGIPYPVYNVWPFTMPVGENKVAGYKAAAGIGIFILVDNGDYAAPSYYRLPWDKDMAAKLAGAGEGQATIEVEGDGTIDLMGSWDFSFKTLPPKVTVTDVPSRPFEPKQIPFQTGPQLVLPPSD